ncbi:MAG: hypothetical protein AAF927_06255 [Bacteroidota bacterium]
MNDFKLLYLCSTILLVFFSCRRGEIIEEFDYGPPSLTAKINGETFSVDSLLVSASYSIIDDRTQTLSISGAPPAFNGIVEGLALVLISADSTAFQTGENYIAGSLNKRGAGEYFVDNGTNRIDALSENTNIATLVITEIDYLEKLVSGTFSFDAFDEDDPDKIYQVREGEFKNVSFD